jgi:hypothetical protein
MSPDFPTTPGAHGLSLQGWEDAFVSKISSNGSALLWSTYLGGDSTDVGTALALDRFGNAIVTGGTSSTNFPTTPGALDRSQNGGSDVFVTEISSTGAVLLWSTFLGGSGNDDGMYDAGLALDPSGNAVLMSWTGSPDFPTTPGAYDRSFDGCYDAFVAKVSPRHLLIAEYLPSDDDDVRPVTTAPSVVSVLARGTGAAFRFTGAPAAPVTVRIFDVAGRLIRSIHASATAAGAQEVLWDGRDETGARAGPGIYFYQAAAEGQIGSGKIAIAR